MATFLKPTWLPLFSVFTEYVVLYFQLNATMTLSEECKKHQMLIMMKSLNIEKNDTLFDRAMNSSYA